MNQLTTIGLNLPEHLGFDDWKQIGADLVHQGRNHQWLLGDWFNFGRSHFPEQLEMVLEQFAIPQKQLNQAATVSLAFKQEERNGALSFSHYRNLSDLPHGEARKIAEKAAIEGWTATRTKREVYSKRREEGQIKLWGERDEEHVQRLITYWNRAPKTARQEFLEMATDADGGVID